MTRIEPWMRGILLLAGFYNLGWGIFIYWFPDAFYQWVTLSSQPAPPVISWQGLGVLLFGGVYILVAFYPVRLWFLLAAGIVSKTVGGLWFYWVVMEQTINRKYLFHLIMNDLVWLFPFTFILWRILSLRKTQKKYETIP